RLHARAIGPFRFSISQRALLVAPRRLRRRPTTLATAPTEPAPRSPTARPRAAPRVAPQDPPPVTQLIVDGLVNVRGAVARQRGDHLLLMLQRLVQALHAHH